jgi:putative two-component system response regulator
VSARDSLPLNATAHPSNQTVTPTGGRILVVDDQEANLHLLSRLLMRDGHVVYRASNGLEALELVSREQPDLVLLDVVMPLMSGFDVCRELKRHASTRLIPVVLITTLQGAEDRIQGIEAGADDFLTKPVNSHELRARVRSLLRIKRYTDDLDSAESVILSLALTIEARDTYTEGHCQRLAGYATAFGQALGLGEDDVAALERGGFLHDIGKVGIPDAVLRKPGPLTSAEYDIVKQHTVIGDRLCGGLRSLRRVRSIVRHHHERLDGSGYPDGLHGDEIPLLAQIMSIVDLFDAITSTRPYRLARSAEHAGDELTKEVARGWRRADLVETFLGLVGSQGLRVLDAASRLDGHTPTGSRT